MSRIQKTFNALKKQRKKATILYVTSGVPSMKGTTRLIVELERQGADLIEVGVPFSDPLADGPTIQLASARALKKGASLRQILQMIRRLRKRVQIPLVIFSYYNPIHAMGLHHFAEQARQAGVDGVLVPDLPPEEGGPLRKALGRVKIPLIFLLSPTSTPARIRRVGRESQGFIYYVSRTGVTGAQKKLDRELVKQVARVKRLSRLPVVIGFGISGPKQAAAAAHMADGVVIGSALMERLLQTGGEARGVQKASRFAKQISSAVKRG